MADNYTRMAKARFLECKKLSRKINQTILQNGDLTFEDFDDTKIIKLRAAGEQLIKCIHELNAYRNVVINNSKILPHRRKINNRIPSG